MLRVAVVLYGLVVVAALVVMVVAMARPGPVHTHEEGDRRGRDCPGCDDRTVRAMQGGQHSWR